MAINISVIQYTDGFLPAIVLLLAHGYCHRGTPPRCTIFLFLMFVSCSCMAINVSVQYNGGLLPDIILLTQCYYHLGTRLNAMKRFCIRSL